jgi:hypothetical protein
LKIIRWLFSWRVIKRVLQGVAVIMGLVALFYLEEDWRGKHAWNKYRREWEAKGESFDFASFVPPPVPDDQNFALAPIVASCYSRYLDKNGRRLRPENTNVVNRLAMTIYRSDVGGFTNATLGNWPQGQKINLKAWQQYYRAPSETNSWERGTNIFVTGAQPQSPGADVLLALSKYDPVFEELRQPSIRGPQSRFPLSYEDGQPFNLVLPHLPVLGNCGEVLALRATAGLANQQSENALNDILLAFRLSNSIRSEPGYNSQAIHLGLINRILQPVWEAVAGHKWSDRQLLEMEQCLGKLDVLGDYPLAMRSDRAMNLTMMEFMRGNRFRALNCIRMINNLSAYDDYWRPNDLDTPLPFIGGLLVSLIPSGWFYSNEMTAAQAFQWLLPERHEKEGAFITVAVKRAEIFREQVFQHTSPYSAIAPMACSGYGSFAEKFLQTQASLDLVRAACALERYRLAHGVYPETLAGVAPQFIESVPPDVINGEPLHYRRTLDGNFVLYSVGWNEKDDGGIPGVRPSGYNDYREGDWVWQFPKR